MQLGLANADNVAGRQGLGLRKSLTVDERSFRVYPGVCQQHLVYPNLQLTVYLGELRVLQSLNHDWPLTQDDGLTWKQQDHFARIGSTQDLQLANHDCCSMDAPSSCGLQCIASMPE